MRSLISPTTKGLPVVEQIQSTFKRGGNDSETPRLEERDDIIYCSVNLRCGPTVVPVSPYDWFVHEATSS